MSTPNFARCNASKIYAFGMNKYLDEETIEANGYDSDRLGEFDECQTQFDAECEIDNCREQLSQKGWSLDKDRFENDWEILAHREEWLEYAGVEINIKVFARITSGYYEGAQFDWDASLEANYSHREGSYVYDEGRSYDLTGEYAIEEKDIIRDDWCDNLGMSKIQAKNIIKKIYSKFNAWTKEAEEVFENCCEKKLACVGIFSNGEAVYTEIG